MTTLYAHALIELGDRKIPRGSQVDSSEFDEVTLKELTAAGSLDEKAYDPAVDKLPPPAEVEIEGVVYVQSTDEMEAADVR